MNDPLKSLRTTISWDKHELSTSRYGEDLGQHSVVIRIPMEMKNLVVFPGVSGDCSIVEKDDADETGYWIGTLKLSASRSENLQNQLDLLYEGRAKSVIERNTSSNADTKFCPGYSEL